MHTEVLATTYQDTQKTGQEMDFSRPFQGRSDANIRALEAWYAADFERRVFEITQLLQNQIAEELRRQFTQQLPSSAVFEEVACTQQALRKKEIELARAASDESCPLGSILELKAARLELNAYLKGLNFQMANTEVNIECAFAKAAS